MQRVCMYIYTFPWLRSTSQVRHLVTGFSRLSITRGRCEQSSFIAADVNITCSLTIDRVHDSAVSHTSPNPLREKFYFIRNVSIPFFLLALLERLSTESCVQQLKRAIVLKLHRVAFVTLYVDDHSMYSRLSLRGGGKAEGKDWFNRTE